MKRGRGSIIAHMLKSPAVVACILVAAVIPARADDPLLADHWIASCPDAERVLVDAEAVTAMNRRMLAEERSVNDLSRLPATLPRTEVVDRIERQCRLPEGPLVFADGVLVGDEPRRHWQASLALDVVPATVEPRFGLVVRRAAIRRFPTWQRVHARAADTDIDQFQETAFFPGTPVAAVHATTDRDWWFVIGPTYAGWVAADSIALGDRAEVLAYAARASRVVTAARAATAFTPDLPAVSQLPLDMGTTLPERYDWPAGTPVNGQSSAASVVVDLPTRDTGGALRVVPALIPRAADIHDGPLPATRANVLRQAFKFLGERYGWGHDFDGRDCSGFVCEVYRSLGILLPRNTRDQAVCPALATTSVAPDWPRSRRLEAIHALLPGDLVYTRRHVMIVVGRDDDGPWVIHDTHEGRTAGGTANGVVLQPFLAIDGGDVIDAVTAVVSVLAPPSATAPR